jgi:hypothetical protein
MLVGGVVGTAGSAKLTTKYLLSLLYLLSSLNHPVRPCLTLLLVANLAAQSIEALLTIA